MGDKLISKIVVPIDGSENSMHAAEYALKLAEIHHADVSVVHVVNIDQYLQSLGLYRISYPDPVKKKVEEAREEAQKWFTELARKAEEKKLKIRTEVIDTPLSVVASVVNYADREKADLIVIGTKGRSGLSKMLLGSVASGVVTYSPCPVLVAK